MSTALQLAAFARIQATHAAFEASYQTDARPAAILACKAADDEFIAAMPGAQVWVKVDTDYQPEGMELGTVTEAYDRGDIRTAVNGVTNWGNFCPATYTQEEARAFFAAQEARLEQLSTLD